MKKWLALLTVPFLTGCSTIAKVTQTTFQTQIRYGYVTSVSQNQITVHFVEPSESEEEITVANDIPIIKDSLTINYSDIQPEDGLLCTFTNGELTVIEVYE